MSALLLLSVLLLFCPLALGQDSIGCFVDGECLNGFTVGISKTNGSLECLEACAGVPSCVYFTHYDDDELCLKFETCPELSRDSCTDCTSGKWLKSFSFSDRFSNCGTNLKKQKKRLRKYFPTGSPTTEYLN